MGILFSKLNKWVTLDNFTLCIGILGQSASYVQAIKIFYLGDAQSVSLWATLISLTSIICWLVYGGIRRIKPLIYCNAIGLIGTLGVLWGIFFYQ